jgi:hypothetical protein
MEYILKKCPKFIYLALSPQQHMPITVGPFCLTHPVNFPCRRKPEYPEETHDFRQSIDFYSFHMRTGFESHWESSHWDLNLRPQRWKSSALTTWPPKPLNEPFRIKLYFIISVFADSNSMLSFCRLYFCMLTCSGMICKLDNVTLTYHACIHAPGS